MSQTSMVADHSCERHTSPVSSGLGSRIRVLRKRAGLSQAALAERVGVGRRTIGRWERGVTSPGVSRAAVVARTLRVDLADLLNDVPVGSPDGNESARTDATVPGAGASRPN